MQHQARQEAPPERRASKWAKRVASTIAVALIATAAGLFGASTANAAGGPPVEWSYANGSYTLTLPASDPWEVKQIVPSQHIFCGTNYGNPCASTTYTLAVPASTCVTVQVDWAGRHGYNSDDYDYCAPPADPKTPETVTGTAKFQTLSCEQGSKNEAVTDTVSGGVWVFTDKNNQTYTTAIGKGYEGDIPTGLAYGTITVALQDGSPEDDYAVTKWKGNWTTVDPASLDCEVGVEPEVVTGTATFQTLSCEAESKNWAVTDTVSGGIWVFTDKNGDTYKTTLGASYTGDLPAALAYGTVTMKLEDGDSEDAYSVTEWQGNWTAVDPALLDCETTTEPPAPPTPPTDSPKPSSSFSSTPPIYPTPTPTMRVDSSEPSKTATPVVLAETGTDAGVFGATFIVASTLIIGGFVLLVVWRRRAVKQ